MGAPHRKREHPRYKVVDLRDLKGSVEGLRAKLQLVTFSMGGCGFYSLEKVPSFSPPKRLFCVFSMDQVLKESVRVQGNLVYGREIKAPDKTVMFYGIEFIKPHRTLVDPVVRALEKLYQQGVIQQAEMQ
jgi:hypothetical protein